MLKIRAATKNFQPDIIIIQNYVRVGMLATRGIALTDLITHMFKCKHFEKLNGVIALTAELAELCEGRGFRGKDSGNTKHDIWPFYRLNQNWVKHVVTIGGMGRLIKKKDSIYLLQAVAKLRTEGHTVKLRSHGKGFEEQKLQRSSIGFRYDGMCEFVLLVIRESFSRASIFSSFHQQKSHLVSLQLKQ